MAAIIATPNDYWISAQALNITPNALGEPNRIQASVTGGAQVMCYMKGIKPESEGPEYAGNGDGLEYDAGHNYRRWPLTVSPTYFNTNEEVYIYIRIPRRASFATQAQVCFPSQLLDIYGRAVVDGEPGEQVGNVNYFYVWLRGRLSASGDDGLTPRTWLTNIETGTLATDEAISPTDTDWYTWNGVMQRVTFLKEIVMAAGSSFLNLILNGKTLNSVAIDSTTEADSTTAVVTPKYIKDVIASRYLSRVEEDYAQEEIGFMKGLWVKAKNAFGISKDGDAKLHDADIDGILRAFLQILSNKITSQNYEGGWDNPFGSGFQMEERSTDHVSFLSVDNLFVRMKAIFTELEIRKISYAGGNIIFSHAGSTIVSVKPVYDTCEMEFDGTTAVLDGSAEFAGTELHVNAGAAFDGTTLKFNDSAQKLVGYRCYLMKDDGTTATENWWRVDDQARCQTFNIDGTGTYHDVSNSSYWRRVMAVGVEQLEDGRDYDYVDLSVIDAAEGSTVPQAGDTIVQMGNRTDTERQGFISIQVAGEYAPSFEVYKGVNSYSLTGKRKICISPKYTEIRANKIVETTETGDYPLPHFRTDPWHTGMQCYYYDVVQHSGSSWLCTYPEGGIGGVPYTTEEPSGHAVYWKIFASEGKDGKDGKNGGEPLTVYAWGTSDTIAPAISGNAYPPAGWSTRITDRPTGGKFYLWEAETIKNGDGVIADWGTPACISGADGTPGEDAKNIEFIFKYDTSGYDGNTGEVNPSGAASGSDTNKQQDDWVPNGWYDRALAVSEDHPDVYMSSRKYDVSAGTWGAFGTPTLWGHFGQKGIDGDGVQYVYKLFDHELTDAERTSNIPTKPAQPNPQGEWIPTGWSDDPLATTTSMPFCYCSIIKEINGTWDNFEKLGLWSKWAEDGKSITKKSESYRYATNNTGVRPAASSPDWSTTKPVLQKGYWLYTETTITWSDDSTTVLYTDERNPNDGAAGQDIIVDRNEITYALTQTNQQPAESAFGPYPSVLTQGWWLWSRSITYYKKAITSESAGSSKNYSVSYIAEDGNDGRGITSITEYYKASANSSGEVAPQDDSGWTTDPNVAMQDWNENKPYLWNYEKITYSSGNPSRSTPCIIALWTEDGAAGKGIDSITNYYKISTKSGVGGDVETYPTTAAEWAQWDDDPVAPTAENPYLWNFEVINWVNPSGQTHTNPQMIGHYGKDGKDTAVALLTPQVVSIPVNSSGQALDDFRQVVPISMSTSSEELSLFEVTILSGGTNVELGPATLESHAGSKTTFDGTTAVIEDAHFSDSTLVVEDEGSTLVSKTLIVKGTKNATITDHVCEIQVRGYDSEMNEYTAKTSLSIVRNVEGKDGQNGADGAAGADGDDAVNVSLTPQSVILTQNEAGEMPTLTDANTAINVKQGAEDVTSRATIVSATPSTYVVSGVTYDTCTCQISGNRVIITAIDQHGTETVEGETINKYAEQGYIDIVVRFGGVNTTVRFNFYCNLLGTWKREVEGDTEHIIATKQFAVYDKDGHVVTHQTMGDYIHSSSENTAKLTDATTDSSGNYIKSSELKQTADGLSSDVSAIKMGKNLLKGALTGSSFGCSTTKNFTNNPSLRDTSLDSDGFITAVENYTYIFQAGVTIEKGKWYTVSFEAKDNQTSVGFCVFNYSGDGSVFSGDNCDTNFTPTTSGKKKTITFRVSGTGSVTIAISINCTALRYPQLEFGETATAFETDSAKETSSSIKQTADTITSNITDGLYNTGVDIENRKITIRSDKVDFKDSSGNDAKFSINSTDGSMKAEGGGTIGGFGIGTTTLGTSTPYNNSGYTYILRDGKIDILNNADADKGYDCGLEVYGGAQLNGAAEKPLYIRNMSGSNNITGHPLNLNTNANNGAYTYIGNPQSKVVVNAESTTFNDQVNLSEETNVGSNGVMTIQGILAMNSSVKTQSFTLPTNPKVGQVFFCKSMSSTLGDLIITAPSGSSIMASDSRTTNTSINIQDNSAFVVCMSSNSWVLFRCN